MHESTLMPYISDAIGFWPTFSANVSWALMSTSSHVPSSRSEARMASHHPLRIGHVVDAVERRDQVDRVVVGQRCHRACRGSWRWPARTRPAARRPASRAWSGDVVAGDRAGRERLGEQQHRSTGTAADVGDPTAGRSAWPTRRRASGARVGTRCSRFHGSKLRSHADGPSRPWLSKSYPTPVRKLSGNRSSAAIGCGRSWNKPMPKASCVGSARTATASGVSENRSAASSRCALVDRDDPRRGLVVRPLPHPALVEPTRARPARWSSPARSLAASARYRPRRSPRWIMPAVTAPSSLEKT